MGPQGSTGGHHCLLVIGKPANSTIFPDNWCLPLPVPIPLTQAKAGSRVSITAPDLKVRLLFRVKSTFPGKPLNRLVTPAEGDRVNDQLELVNQSFRQQAHHQFVAAED